MGLSARNNMDFKRIFRGPIIYIVLAIAAVWIGSTLLTGTGFREISTAEGLDLLKGNTVESAKIVDGEQRVDLTLSKADGDNGTKVQFYYVAPRGTEIVDAINTANVKFDDEVPQTNFFTSLIGILLPFLIIGVIFYFLLSRMQGGGNRVMQFGKSKAKLVGKEAPKVTFGDSFETSFALDFPNCMTLEPPPCMPESMSQKKAPMRSTGRRMPMRDRNQLVCGTSSL